MAARSPFNAWFDRLLKERKLTHMDAAFILGVHVSTVDKLAAGHSKAPDYAQLRAIVRAFRELPPELRTGCPGLESPPREEAG